MEYFFIKKWDSHHHCPIHLQVGKRHLFQLKAGNGPRKHQLEPNQQGPVAYTNDVRRARDRPTCGALRF